jgi:hypothetical protein
MVVSDGGTAQANGGTFGRLQAPLARATVGAIHVPWSVTTS